MIAKTKQKIAKFKAREKKQADALAATRQRIAKLEEELVWHERKNRTDEKTND